MSSITRFNDFIGNPRVVQILRRAIEQDRLPHAMIFAGPAGVGKCTLALLVAQYLNCPTPVDDDACGVCPVCRRITAVIESRRLVCEKGADACGNCSACRIRSAKHPDIHLVEPEKTTIGIDQVRKMIGEIAFQPLEARYRVVILDPADKMSMEAHNSLLKTMEEPPSRTVIILVTTNPYLLLETIRSRSRMLHFGEIAQDKIARHLVRSRRMSDKDARLAAALCGGSLASALDFNAEAFRETREEAFRFISLLLTKGKFMDASAIAAKITKDRNTFLLWLESAEALLQDIYYVDIADDRVGQHDMIERMKQLRRKTTRSTLVQALDAIGELKAGLKLNVNRQIALEAMFLSTR
jgi:DNA polymerase III subunit delta'